MTPSRVAAALRRAAVLAAALPLLAACSDLTENDTIGTRPDPSGGAAFRTYMALGTSLSAGFQSGGINDSTQRESPAYLLALSMGLLPGSDWEYPSLRMPGCPAPLINPLTGLRVGGTPPPCATRNSSSVSPVIHNLAIPGLRAEQVLNVADTAGVNGLLQLAQFISGGRNPIDLVEAAAPSFVTLEVGANEILGGATAGDTTLMTSVAAFQAAFTAIADRLEGTGAQVAVANVPSVTRVPFFTRASTLFCLKTGLCGIPAMLPFSSPLFTVDNSCAPAAAGGIGDNYLLTFPATGAIVSALAAGGPAVLNCLTDVATAGPNPAGPTLNSVETAAVAARVAALNAFILSEANARSWAHANLDSALGANAAAIPPLPSFTTPTALMGPLFSQDGVHPSRAGYVIMANTFRNAINQRYGTALPVIN